MSHYHERAWAEANGTDLRDFTPPPPPVCAKQALWESQTRADDAAERDERIAAQVVAEKADKRARSARDYATEIEQTANHLARLMGAARTDGFGVVGAEEMKDLARNAVWRLREQQEQAHG